MRRDTSSTSSTRPASDTRSIGPFGEGRFLVRQTLGVLVVAALIILVGLAIRWLSGAGQRGPGSGKETDPFEHNASSAGDDYQRP
jgi:hypothetical protein